MCGIAGICGPVDRQPDREVLGRMQDMLRHRGPDGAGMYVDNGVGLAMRRLAIIDVAGGDQPIANEDKTVQLIFNGEIYNFQALREELIALGHQFATSSDTEVVVHAYEQYGIDCPKVLRGMFAFAIWDRAKQRLLLARDRVGKKPLLYAHRGDTLVFASEFRAMLAHPDVGRDVDEAALHQYMSFMCVPAPLTAFRDIRKLEPGHTLTWERGRIRIEKYWSLDFKPKLAMSESDAASEALEKLREAVRLRMISEVPVGAFLSGGIDSSSVVAMMASQSSEPIKTFSIGFDDADYDELAYAKQVASAFGTDHHEFVVRPSAAEILPTLVDHYGEPYADSSAIPTYYIARETRRYVTVALNGDGGDETFAGYRRFAAMQLAEQLHRLPASALRAARFATRGVSGEGNERTRAGELRRFAGSAMLPRVERYMNIISAFDDEAKRELYTADFAERVGEVSSASAVAPWLDRRDIGVVDALLLTDTMTYLPNDLLVKVDIATMAVSLEARSPYLDHHMIEFAARLPERYKLRRLTTKYLLKKALRGLLPQRNVHRKKMGFGVPVAKWFRNELRATTREVILSDRALGRGMFRPEAVQRLVDEHVSGARDWANRLWTLLMLELWYQRFVDSPASAIANDTCQTAIAH